MKLLDTSDFIREGTVLMCEDANFDMTITVGNTYVVQKDSAHEFVEVVTDYGNLYEFKKTRFSLVAVPNPQQFTIQTTF